MIYSGSDQDIDSIEGERGRDSVSLKVCYENENCTWCSYIYVSNQPVKKAGHQSKGQGHRSSA